MQNSPTLRQLLQLNNEEQLALLRTKTAHELLDLALELCELLNHQIDTLFPTHQPP